MRGGGYISNCLKDHIRKVTFYLGESGWQRQGGRESFHFIPFCTFSNSEPCECITDSKKNFFYKPCGFTLLRTKSCK